VTDHSLEATPPSEEIANALTILAAMPYREAPVDNLSREELDFLAVRRLLASARARAQTLETEVAQMRGALAWLRDHYLAADFEWGDPDKPTAVIVFGPLPEKTRVTGDFGIDVEHINSLSSQRRDETPA